MVQGPLEQKIEEIIAPSLEAMGYVVVRVALSGGKQRTQLQVMAERHDVAAITVEDCATISRQVSALLEVQDPIQGAYTLEVSSPGIDRPLVKEQDFVRYAGHEAKLETAYTIDGRKRFRGMLKGITDGTIGIEVDGTECAVPLEALTQAKLVLTDALIAAHTKQEQGVE